MLTIIACPRCLSAVDEIYHRVFLSNAKERKKGNPDRLLPLPYESLERGKTGPARRGSPSAAIVSWLVSYISHKCPNKQAKLILSDDS